MKRTLHHYSKINTYQFVTFRTKASVDDFLSRLKDSNLDESTKQLKLDAYLDKSDLGRLLNGEIINSLIKYFKKLQPHFIQLVCVSIMPNHVHILFEQKQQMKVIMQKLKGGSAFLVNQKLKLSGAFWERDYFDKTVRDERQFQITYAYIKNNAIKAGLQDADKRFYGVFE